MRLKLIPRSVTAAYLRVPPIPRDRDKEIEEERGAGLKIPLRITFAVVLTTAIFFLFVLRTSKANLRMTRPFFVNEYVLRFSLNL